MTICSECNKELKILNHLHLRSHKMTCERYKKKYNVELTSWNKNKDCSKYHFGRKMGCKAWNKGKTKETHPGVKKYGITASLNKTHRKPNIKNHNNMLGKKIPKHVVRKRTKTWLKNYADGKINLAYNQYKAFYREDILMYVRSTWEANFVRILNYLNIPFEYEKYRFKLKNGKVYNPDFKIKNIFYEVKGYWRKKAKKKFNMFKKQYPEIKIKVVDLHFYSKLEKRFRHKISNWE